MNIQSPLHQGHQFITDLQFLTTQGRGPSSAKARIAAWIDLLEQDEVQAWQGDALASLCDALSVLAFANAAFRKLPAASRGVGLLPFEIEDRGGYYVALKTIENVLAAAPFCADAVSELRRHVERTLFGYMEQIDRLLAQR